MTEYFVRVYYMKDGSRVEIMANYATYQQAVDDLLKFNPNGDKDHLGDGLGATPEEDMQLVSYAQIEKRFAPPGYWE